MAASAVPSLQGLEQHLNAELRGLAVKAQTRLLEEGSRTAQPGPVMQSAEVVNRSSDPEGPAGGPAASTADAQPAQPVAGLESMLCTKGLFGGGVNLVQSSILEPCDITTIVKMTDAAQVSRDLVRIHVMAAQAFEL